MLAAQLAMVEIRDVKDNVITAVFYNGGGTSKQIVEKKDNLSVIMFELREFFKTNLKITFVLDPNKKTEPTKKAAVATGVIDTEKILEEDENLKNLINRIDGEIIDIKNVENDNNL